MSATKEHHHDTIEAGQRGTKQHPIGWLNMPGFIPATWNPIVGCKEKSEGCKHCFAKKMAFRLMHMPHTSYYQHVLADNGETDPEKFKNIPEWNGETHFVKSALDKPMKWKSPRMIFTVDMGDLFHEQNSFDWIDQVFTVMACNPQHIFIVLTKRPKNMLKWFTYKDIRWAGEGMQGSERLRYYCWHNYGKQIEFKDWHWPLQNVWLGITAENQEQANKRIPILLQIPAAKNFVSIEPMLGPVFLGQISLPDTKGLGWQGKIGGYTYLNCLTGEEFSLLVGNQTNYKLDWVICGGKSGHKARPMHPDWARSLRDQCKAAGVPFFFKQWGEWMDFQEATSLDNTIIPGQRIVSAKMDRFPDKTEVIKVGRKYTGNLLDGQQHHEWPKINL